MSNSQVIWKNQTRLRTGYTTGSCAAAAAKAAAHMLLFGEEIDCVNLKTPSGRELLLEVEDIQKGFDSYSCAIRKDSGDDPDITNGILVYASVSYGNNLKVASERFCLRGLTLEAGEGIGIVTRKGLEQEIGEPAINPVPRKMILEAVYEEQIKSGYKGELSIRIWVPEGTEIGKKTFNPQLGIEGGISILGTSGIVEPMSEKALTDTIFLEMKVRKENGADYCFVVPGNYGSDFLREMLGYQEDLAVKCSNFVGEAIDHAVSLQMKGILLVGHIGKFVKLAAGIMNTHSRQADGRMEILAAYTAACGGRKEVVCQLLDCATTKEALEILKREGLLEPVMGKIMERIEHHISRRAGEELMIGAVMYSMEEGILGKTKQADELIEYIKGEQ